MLLVGKTIGPFTIDRELGAGAMGAVYRARHNESGKWVAIKVVAAGLATNETVMQRFEREWEILKQLKHPNIVRLIASGRFGGTPFYAMEYVEGESLDRIMARRGRISWEEVVRLGQQLCAALQHAHDKGIVHRDLKPSNLMILKNGQLKLTDFGIAKDLDRTAITEANCTVGTAAYMSPEQCKGERNLTHKSDLYSMGIMFYELLTGKKPFEAESPMDMFMQHVKGKFERPSRIAMEVPFFLDTLVCQLMEKEPERRPYSAEKVAEALGMVEQKVLAQQAAGIDAAKMRNKDKPGEVGHVDDEDREAARALLGKKKKRKHEDEQPSAFYQQTWFKALALAVPTLLIAALLAWLLLVKPSPETLLARAEQARALPELEDRVEARKHGAIYQYITYYGDRDDEMTRKVRRIADEIDAEDCERLVLKRIKQNINTGLDDDEKECRKAIKAEEDGDLKAARKIWAALEKYKEPAKAQPTDKRSYALMAESRLETINKAEEWEKKVDKGLKEAKGYNPTGDEKVAADAMKLEQEQKWDDARNAWKELFDPAKNESSASRPWYLLAAKRLKSLEKK